MSSTVRPSSPSSPRSPGGGMGAAAGAPCGTTATFDAGTPYTDRSRSRAVSVMTTTLPERATTAASARR